MKRSLYALRFCLLVAGATWADIHTTLDFADLNAALSNNTLMVNGSTSNLLVTGGGSGNDYIYSVAYAGADFDADGTNDTLVFDLLVEGFSGTVATNAGLGASSAAIGSADAGVFVAGQKWHVVDDRMNAGETLRFTVLNPTSSVGSVAFEGFGSVAAHEGASYGHEAVIGEGTGLDGYTFNDNLTMAVSPAESPLFVSSATANATKAQWGVGHVDFGLTVRVEAERRVVEWDGTVDGNWNMPGNWLTGAVPGTDPGDWVILSGSNDAPVVATVVETTNSCAIRIDDGASLEVADGKLRCEGIVLDGGQLQLVGGADVEVSGDLRVGDSPGSSVGLRSGSLAVDGEV